MALDDVGKLSIAVLIFFCPAFLASIHVSVRQGLSRQLGWFYLASLSIVRIIGASCYLAAEQNLSVGLFTTTAIMNSIGLIPLLLALMGMLSRINGGMPPSHRFGPQTFHAVHLASLGALALGIVAGVKVSRLKDPDALSVGLKLRKVSSMLVLAILLLLCLVTGRTYANLKKAFAGDKPLIYAALISIPFLVVRLLYTLLMAWKSESPVFNISRPNIYAMAFMQSLMEFALITLYLVAGLYVPSVIQIHSLGRLDQQSDDNTASSARKQSQVETTAVVKARSSSYCFNIASLNGRNLASRPRVSIAPRLMMEFSRGILVTESRCVARISSLNHFPN